MNTWHAEIVEGFANHDLVPALQWLTNEGWRIRFVLPNGVNRWTIIASKP